MDQRRARDVAEGADEPAPIELQIGWLVEKYGIGILGDEMDIKLVMRANKLVSIHRVFSKLSTAGIKHMTPAEFMFIRDAMRDMA